MATLRLSNLKRSTKEGQLNKKIGPLLKLKELRIVLTDAPDGRKVATIELPSEEALALAELALVGLKIGTDLVIVGDHPLPSAIPSANSIAADVIASTFVHPYNFVSIPQDGLGEAAKVEPFIRRAAPGRDRWRHDEKLFSGRLDCLLATKKKWFIPDPRKVGSVRVADGNGEHKVLGPFTLEAVNATAWSDNPFAAMDQDGSTPAIPGASIRGMVRSVFEAVTMSCFSIFDPERLDFRVPRDLTSPDSEYLPVRVTSIAADGSATVQVMDGRPSSERTRPPLVLPVGLVQAYTPSVNAADAHEEAWCAIPGLEDGAPVVAVVDAEVTPKYRTNNGQRRHVYSFRKASVLPAERHGDLAAPQPGRRVVFGYLHRTGPNIENKHDERFFFQWDAAYNLALNGEDLAERFDRFMAPPCVGLSVDSSVIEQANCLLAAYGERHAKNPDIETVPPRHLEAESLRLSDFVVTHQAGVRQGSLMYALIDKRDGQRTIRGLFPVAMPRLPHESTRGDLLPGDFHACSNSEGLCPACRVFGWVKEGAHGQADVALASCVRFSHGVLTRAPQNWRAERYTTPVLGEPKPTTTAFYLRSRPEFATAFQHRWPSALRSLPQSFPLYRANEATLRGRKFYRHRSSVDLEQGAQSNQTQTVSRLPGGMTFGFRVWFEDLTDRELAALIFSLTLSQPDAWSPAKLLHQIGRGKPLGMGAVQVKIANVSFIDETRFTTWEGFESLPGFDTLPAQQPALADLLKPLATSWQEAESADSSVEECRLDLIEMLRADTIVGDVMYPPASPQFRYQWFGKNAKSNGRHATLPNPRDEREGVGRLPKNPSQ